MSSLLYALDKTYSALAKPPVPCEGCLGWVGGKCQWGADWKHCVKEDDADDEVASGEVKRG